MTTDDLIYLIGLKETQLQVANLEINKLRQEVNSLQPAITPKAEMNTVRTSEEVPINGKSN